MQKYKIDKIQIILYALSAHWQFQQRYSWPNQMLPSISHILSVTMSFSAIKTIVQSGLLGLAN